MIICTYKHTYRQIHSKYIKIRISIHTSIHKYLPAYLPFYLSWIEYLSDARAYQLILHTNLKRNYNVPVYLYELQLNKYMRTFCTSAIKLSLPEVTMAQEMKSLG